MVLNPDRMSPGQTISRPFRENSNPSKTAVPRKRHVSLTRRFRGKNQGVYESRHLPPWSQRRREGRSPAVLEAPRRELIGQRQRSPAAYPASAGGRRSLRGLLVSNPSSRSPLGPWFGDAPQRVAVELVPSTHDASCRASVSAASAFETITRAAGVTSDPPGDDPGRRSRERSKVTDFLRGKTTWEWRVGTRRLTQIRAHRSIWGLNRFDSRIPV